MKSELLYTQHPKRIRFFWLFVYCLVVASLIFGVYITATRIRTHTLPKGKVELSIPYSKYLVGETISFSIKNSFDSPIYIMNNCPSEPLAVYKLESNQWVRQHDQASVKDCPNEQRQVMIPTNGVVNGNFEAWKNLFAKPGKYRVVAFVEFYNALPYQEFEVLSPPPIAPVVPAVQPTSPASLTPSGTTITPPSTTRKSKTVSTSSGSISVEYDSTNIYVTDISPANGCGYEGGRSGRQVEITFKCGGRETQITLTISNGQLVYRIEH